MDVDEIARKLNDLASKVAPLNNLQPLRAELKELERPRTYSLFSAATIFEEYAFHDGGRGEIQFNIAIEYIDDQEIFRYGLAFSIEGNINQPDPIRAMEPRIKAFNDYYLVNPTFMDGLSMWHYKEPGISGRSEEFEYLTIPSEWVVYGNFIFIGQYFRKSVDEIDDNDLKKIVALFNRLMPVFEYVETNYHKFKEEKNEDRISRICWNNNGWVQPSGPYGKSTNREIHEGQYGYGHEEWNGDISKVINGYHYGFLESIRKDQASFSGKTYNIELFAINAINHNRYLIGRIDNVEVLTDEISQGIKLEYAEKGWLQEMENQIIAAGANSEGFSEWNGVELFNIRFMPTDLHFYSDYVLVNEDETIKNIKRYTFVRKTENIVTTTPVNAPFVFEPNEPIESTEDVDIEVSSYERNAQPIEITYLHKKIRDALHKHLTNLHGNTVGKENPTGKGTLIDVVRKEGDKYIFYEIKTYYTIKACIREAIGQILEYAYYPDTENAQELIIVSQNGIDEESQKYLNKLRAKFKLPIFYQQFNLASATLSEKY